jgi:hypothetical protein
MDAAVALEAEADALVATRLRERVIQHLATAKERELREGQALPPPSSEQMAMAIIRQAAAELGLAATALDRAAHVLREKGCGVPASATKQAAGRARAAQQGLTGTP